MTDLPEGFPIPKETRPWSCPLRVVSCTRKTPCARCRGARNRRSGMRKQRAARKPLERLFGRDAAKFSGQLGNEESWSGLPVRVEVKSGAQIGPAWTAYAKAETQANTNHAVGDTRPFVMVAMPKDTTDGLFLCRLSDLERVLHALVEEV